MKKQFLTLLILPASIGLVSAQDSTQLDTVTDKIDLMFESDSSVFFFEFEKIPTEFVTKIRDLNYSIQYSVFSYEGKSEKKKKSSREMIERLEQRHKDEVFIAGEKDGWRSTDVTFKGQEKFPKRKFLFGVVQGNDMMFAYCHGGDANHLHWVLIENNSYSTLTGFTTMNNYNALKNLEREGRLKNVRQNGLSFLVNEEDVQVLRGNVIKDSCPF